MLILHCRQTKHKWEGVDLGKTCKYYLVPNVGLSDPMRGGTALIKQVERTLPVK